MISDKINYYYPKLLLTNSSLYRLMPHQTITFVVSDDLYEWLEEEKEKRMTSWSSTAQQLLADKCRKEKEDLDSLEKEKREQENKRNQDSSNSKPDSSNSKQDRSDFTGFDYIQKYEDEWYYPDGKQDYALPHPKHDHINYYSSKEGLDSRLKEYEEKDLI